MTATSERTMTATAERAVPTRHRRRRAVAGRGQGKHVLREERASRTTADEDSSRRPKTNSIAGRAVALLVAAAGLVGVEAAHLRQRRWDAAPPPPPSSSLPSAAAAAAAGGERRLVPAAGRGDPDVSCALAEEAACRAAAACRWRRVKGACVARRSNQVYSTSAVDDRPACRAAADGSGFDECGPGTYCKLDHELCAALDLEKAGVGRCVSTAVACADRDDPVCGCDGKTYANKCRARKAGMSVAARGACPETAPEVDGSPPPPAPAEEVVPPPVATCLAGADGRGRDDAACGAGRFCRLDAGTCGALAASATGAGRCAVRPDMCTEEADPVCGCDGTTYDNKCKADAAGMSVRGRGACPKPPPSDVPGPGAQGAACAAGADGRSPDPDDCGEGHFCRLELGRCAGLESREVAGGRCEAKPEMCTRDMDPVCGCDGDTYPNACAARAAGTSVRATEACPEGDKTEAPKVDQIEAPKVDDVKEPDADDRHVDVMCMLDIFICPDGSEVSRDSANGCEFVPCPKADKMEAPQESPVNKGDDVAGTPHEDVVCMEDARVCPDGSWVSRDSDNGCQFAPCPQADKMEAPQLAPVTKEEDVAAPHVDVVCTSDYQVCPDGSRVKRDKDNGCVFAPCPSLQQHEGPDSQGDCEVAASGLGDDEPCGAGTFCRLEAGTCGNLAPAQKGRGRCVAQAEVCTMQVKTVCGCNGRTYSNACQAGADRMSVAHEGPCDTKKSDASDLVKDPSRSPKEEVFSCDPGGRCGAAGSTCAAGTETCCGETHDALRCQCEDAGGGALAYSCFATDACNRRCPEDKQENVNQGAKKEDPLV